MCRVQPSFRCCDKLITSLPPKVWLWLADLRVQVHTSLRELSYLCTLQRREEIQKHNVKEDNTILLQFRSRNEEAAVSSSMMIHHQRRSKEQGPYLVTSDFIVF
jgi:hypothetical protein